MTTALARELNREIQKEEKDIADLFDLMFPCARGMAETPGGVESVPDSAFEE